MAEMLGTKGTASAVPYRVGVMRALAPEVRFQSVWENVPLGSSVCVRTDGNESRRACPELVERGRLNFKPVQIRFERRLGSATTL